ncbi:MAG: transposase [Myxococcaceae bacterium]
MNKKKTYSDEFKTEAVRRVQEGKKPAQVAREMGCDRQNVFTWLKRAQEVTGEFPTGPAQGRRAQGTGAPAARERAPQAGGRNPKKAAAFFARELK